MAAMGGRGPAVIKGGGGGGDRPVGSRLVSVAVGGFLFFLVLLRSSRHDVAVVLDARTGDVRVRPRQQGGRHGHLQQSAEQSNGTAAAEPFSSGVSDAVTGGDRNDDDVETDAAPEEAERQSNAAAATINSVEQAQPEPAAEDAPQDKSLTTAQPAVQTTSPPHGLPGDIAFTTRAGPVDQQRQPLCDTSDSRADVCDVTGDVRMDASASAFVVVVGSAGGADGQTYKVRPYPRKGDATSMGRVTEITVRTAAGAGAAPRCTASHAEPAVVFSIGGYTGNLFHDFTDVIVPMYNAAQRYGGDVRLVVTDAAPRWLAKYGALLRGLSHHAPLDLAKAAAAGEVHCFGHAVVGLRAHRELMIERERSPDGVGMPDFTRFLRRALSLPRDAPTSPGGATGCKPRLLIVSRRGTRLILNTEAVVRTAEEVGFEAVVSELDVADDDVGRVGRLINSFDAMVGVHGADLTNMVFLPTGAAMVQIVPWGGLQWIARMDFGDPAEAMGLRYIQYEIAVHESSLKDKYPRDHEIFTNPTALHKKGFKFLRNTFLKSQDIIVDVDRFRAVLLQALENLSQ
ncbi:hypothetical protein SEVIR_5G078700v4 [Setaria viridis]|uniref:Glycosyltransferase 61 catalytic domain-containing protein n=1 Tax=Setaria viridis TaxID=4556 RepID=A0A4U6UHB7_SETVI|nr:alpha-1,3-arabinosyltransferase XAT3-like [Setaria viridis]TKW13129.1 hypothetical protein SEVIR_5G078700v2 [Setaria viridis]